MTQFQVGTSGPLAPSILQLDPELPLPARAHAGDAGVDLRARVDAVLAPDGGRFLMATGVAIALIAGTAGLILPRSGLAARYGITVVNAPGLIDAGYRGELFVPLLNTDPTRCFEIRRGDRIAQLVVIEVILAPWVAVDMLPDWGDGNDDSTDQRGTGGFGHTGIA